MTTVSTREWYSPSETLQLFERYYNRVEAKSEIADRLRDGLIRAHADLIWDCRERDMKHSLSNREKSLQNKNKSNPSENLEITAPLWRDSNYWSHDIEQWMWEEGIFCVTLSMTPPDRTILEGVKLSKEDVDRFVISRAPKPGGKPKYDGWAQISLLLLQLEREGKLSAASFKSGDDLGWYVYDVIAKSGGDKDKMIQPDSTVRVCSIFWNKLHNKDDKSVS